MMGRAHILIAAAATMTVAAPVVAEDKLSAQDGPREAARVSFSRAVDLPADAPVFFQRSGFGESGATVDVSRRPFRRVRAPGIARSVAGAAPQTGARFVTSGFGMRRHPLLGGGRAHLGIDIAASTGSPVLAPADGTVSTAGWVGSYGIMVAIEHSDGMQTRYAHLSRLNVVRGQRVSRGDTIGLVGSTGRSTGPHLHYETRINGQAINPLGR